MTFQIGDEVMTKTGYTKGTILEVITNDNGLVVLDIQSDAGPKYRNCDARAWCLRTEYTGPDRHPKELERGDRGYITATFDGEVVSFAGTVVTTNPKEVFMSFDDGMKSQWVPRKSVTRGEPPDE